MHFWKPVLALTFVSFSFAYFYTIYKNLQKKKKPLLKQTPSPEAKYISERKRSFLLSYIDKCVDVNENIEPEFYDKDQYNSIMKEESNTLETAWKKRILLDSTPRGNVVLFYDPYKHGFSYYSDQHIPYSLLNAAAMKYVCTFKCRDFFMDEEVTPEYSPSALLSLRIQEEKKESTEKKSKKIESTAFAKFKNYTKVSDPISAAIISNKIQKVSTPNSGGKEYARNKFIYIGKLANWNILTKKVKVPDVSVRGGDILGYLGENRQKQVFNYRDYKKSLLIF
jgi:hypothetical protein